jgi:hypothetical protein
MLRAVPPLSDPMAVADPTPCLSSFRPSLATLAVMASFAEVGL